ncbi:hypothetical protein GCM10022200_14380 [Microbacterium awajiense]|uniref:ABC3 transporter permease C-terminal domain-containing protein n=1 Tax=Microbacterium awajiense TaxID=415214 RepID=A0ABP7AHM5_9MICO
MLRLICADLRDARFVWLAAFAVAAVAAVAVSVPAVLLASAERSPDRGGLALFSLAGFTVALTAVAALAVLTTVLRLTVTVRAAAISLWAAIGLSPAAVRAVIATEVLAVSVLGAVAGALVGVVVAPGFVAYGLTGTVGLTPVEPRADAVTAGWSALAVVLICVPCAIAAGRRAARLSPLIAIRRDTEPPPRAGWRRPATALALVALVASMIAALRDRQAGSQLLLIGPLLAGAVAAAGPVIVAPFERAWSRPLTRWTAAAALGRASAVFGPRRDDATVSAAVVAIGLPTGLLAGAHTLSALSGGSAAGTAPAVALLVGGPTVLAAAAAAVAAAMGAAARGREQAAVRAAGADERTTLAAAAIETAVHGVTAAAAVGLVLVVAAVAESVALGSAVAGVGPAALVVATGGVLIATVGASALVVRRGIRRPVPDVLAVR